VRWADRRPLAPVRGCPGESRAITARPHPRHLFFG